MKKRLLILLLVTANIAYAQVGSEPDPWWKQVENWQTLAVKWIGALTVIVGALATLAALVVQKLTQIRNSMNEHVQETDKRLCRQREDIQIAQAQIVDIAKQVPPPVSQPIQATIIEQPKS